MNAVIHVETRGSVGIIELARPDRHNCLSMQTFSEIAAQLQALESDAQVRAVLLCARGKNFCTGAELDEVMAVRRTPEQMRRFLELGHETLNRIEDSRLPVIAAVQGLCLAGGLECVMACDVVFAADTARFGDQHAQYGLVPGWGGSKRLPRLVGQRRAMDLMLSARWITAAEARDWGLVNHVVEADRLRERALAYCDGIAERSGTGITLMKRLASPASRDDLRADLRAEIENVIPALMAPETGEGLNAFKERRQPRFNSSTTSFSKETP